MPPDDPELKDPSELEKESKESIERVRRIVEENEGVRRDDTEPPLIRPKE
jgi:hypothetical protein